MTKPINFGSQFETFSEIQVKNVACTFSVLQRGAETELPSPSATTWRRKRSQNIQVPEESVTSAKCSHLNIY